MYQTSILIQVNFQLTQVLLLKELCKPKTMQIKLEIHLKCGETQDCTKQKMEI